MLIKHMINFLLLLYDIFLNKILLLFSYPCIDMRRCRFLFLAILVCWILREIFCSWRNLVCACLIFSECVRGEGGLRGLLRGRIKVLMGILGLWVEGIELWFSKREWLFGLGYDFFARFDYFFRFLLLAVVCITSILFFENYLGWINVLSSILYQLNFFEWEGPKFVERTTYSHAFPY